MVIQTTAYELDNNKCPSVFYYQAMKILFPEVCASSIDDKFYAQRYAETTDDMQSTSPFGFDVWFNHSIFLTKKPLHILCGYTTCFRNGYFFFFFWLFYAFKGAEGHSAYYSTQHPSNN